MLPEPSPEQIAIRDAARRYIAQECDLLTRLRGPGAAAAGAPQRWREFARMGWLGLIMPEKQGGSGATMADLWPLLVELGRGLVLDAYLPNLLGGIALARCDEASDLLRRLVAGELRFAAAFDDATPTRATPFGKLWTVSGHKAVVLGAPEADLLVVSAEQDLLLLVPRCAPGLTLRSYPLVDGRMAGDVVMQEVVLPAKAVLAIGEAGRKAVEEIVLAGVLGCVAEMVGAMDAALERTIAHLRSREQFGVRLATLQSLRHRLVDMFIACEESAVLGWRAAQTFSDPAARSATVAAAMAYTGPAAIRVCEEAIQMHGAVAIVDEFPVGHYLKRVVVAERLFGSAEQWLDHFGAGLGDESQAWPPPTSTSDAPAR